MDASWRAGIEDPWRSCAAPWATSSKIRHRPIGGNLPTRWAACGRPSASAVNTRWRGGATVAACDRCGQDIGPWCVECDDPETRAIPSGGRARRLIWADKLHAAVLGHQRSLTTLAPWAPLLTAAAAADAALASLRNTMPTLASLPGLCAAATAILTHRQADRAQPPVIARSARLEAFQRSAAAATDCRTGFSRSPRARANCSTT